MNPQLSSQLFLFLNQTTLVLGFFLKILEVWWWLFAPIILFFPFKNLYLWYIRDKWYAKKQFIVLEIKIPKEIKRPMKAMEQVISNFWTSYDPPNFREKWIEGKFLLSFSLEIASINGAVHFFIRIPKELRGIFESAIYSQYPDVEISEVEDYTKKVPQNIPNSGWDLWGCDFQMLRQNCYPIKTYSSFFEPSQEIKEENIIDPLSVLIEGLSTLKEGEQFWFQIMAKPFVDEIPWVSQAKETVNKLVKRPGKKREKSILASVFDLLVFDIKPNSSGEEKKEELIPPEMQLTPGEKDIVKAIENKISKQAFEVNIRFIYLARKDVFFKPKIKFGFNFSSGLSTSNLNGLKPWPVTSTRIPKPSFFRKRRIYVRKRRIFKNFVKRRTPLFPKEGGTFVLNTEELATIFHFPGKASVPAPAFPRIDAKKGGPPTNLPVD
ncbi:hypothetical protein J7J23_01845 [bacterium]|nr:hypothetical protein [bacterium]